MTVYRHENSGFLRQSRHSPSAIAIVVALHAAAITAAFLVKSGAVRLEEMIPINVRQIEQDIPDPVDVPPPPEPENIVEFPPVVSTPIVPVEPPQIVRVDLDPPRLPQLPQTPITDTTPDPQPVLVDASFDRRYRSEIQPRYPTAMRREGQEGSCTVRVHIGADGRVTEARPVRSTHQAFCDATVDQATRRWRFRPATRDGRPVDSWQQQTVVFQLTG